MIQEVINNQEQAEAQERNGVTVYPTEKILGSIKPVKDFAAFFAKHRTDLAVIKASYLLDYCESLSFTPEELRAFKIGLDCFPKFFESSSHDVESYILTAEKQNKSVG